MPRVLVVDDEMGVRVTVAANLELEGFETVEVQSGPEALEVLGREKIDIVLSDIRMPGMTGVELYHRIRAQHPELPVVLMTAFALEQQVRDAIRKGVFAVLSKPFDIEHAVRVLRSATERPSVLVFTPLRPDAALATGLAAATLRVRSVADADAALATARSERVDVCVSDLGAAHGDRLFIDSLREVNPLVIVLLVAGVGDDGPGGRLASSKAYAFLNAPVGKDELVELIAKARGDARRFNAGRG